MALYIFFFPQLIAGPILRWNAIAPQLEHRVHNTAKFAEGVRRFAGGLAKKMIIANSVAVPADQIFALPADELSASVAWLGLACYTIQIYFDFLWLFHSDMAVEGADQMFGFEFIENFQFPYTAQSIRDFWHRWHISLSTWFRDYVYIPAWREPEYLSREIARELGGGFLPYAACGMAQAGPLLSGDFTMGFFWFLKEPAGVRYWPGSPARCATSTQFLLL